MTTSHLDDEALSAALDGGATAPEQAHLSSCTICRARVEALAAVARAVGTPVDIRPASEVDDAIERAISAWPGSAPVPDATTPEAAQLSTPTPLRDRNQGRPKPSNGRSRRWLGAATGIAAAVIVVGGVVALSRGGPSHPSTTAGLAQPSAASTTPAPRASVSAGDLGDQSDPAALAHRVAALVAQRAGADAAAAPASGSTTASGRAAAPNDQLATATCVADAAAATGVTGTTTPSLIAPLRWRGEPAVVVVFSRPSGLAGAVMRRSDCSILSVLPL